MDPGIPVEKVAQLAVIVGVVLPFFFQKFFQFSCFFQLLIQSDLHRDNTEFLRRCTGNFMRTGIFFKRKLKFFCLVGLPPLLAEK